MMNLLTLAQAAEAGAAVAAPENFHLSAGGWVVMLLSVGFVTSLLGWCIYKVLTIPGSEQHLHSQADIETPDVREG